MQNNEYDYDIIFCALPPLAVERVYSGPAVLKAVVQSAGYRARCFDFAIDLFNFCGRDLDVLGNINNSFVTNAVLSDSENIIVEKFYDHVIKTVINSKSRYFGFTVFSMYTQSVAINLILRLHKLGLGDRIIIGGRGTSTEPWPTIKKYIDISNEEYLIEFGDIVVNRGLIKHVIKGDGEEAILNFLRDQKTDPKLQHHLSKLKHFYPDYSDFDFSQYNWAKGVQKLDVTGSIGCVRDCDFCDVKKQFGKFGYKAGADLAEELIYNQQTYGINDFAFTDSLVNGGMKPFTQFISRLAEYNSTAVVPITWSGMFICRDFTKKDEVANTEYYRLLSQSGATGLGIGAESGSNQVLDSINKKTTVEALFHDLKHFRKWEITCSMLTFTGHWSERHEDFIDHCRMFIKFMPYIRSGNIIGVALGTPYKLLKGTPAFNNINMIKDPQHYDIWISRNNRGNTFKTRLQRRLVLSRLATALNMGVDFDESFWLSNSVHVIKEIRNISNEFFEKYAQGDTSQFEAIADVDNFVKEILDYKDTFELELTVEAQSFNGDPELMITVNEHQLLKQSLSQGQHTINLTIDRHKLGNSGHLEISLTNKNVYDTQIDHNGQIINDKAIIIKELMIDDCDLINDVDFFKEQFYYKTNKSVVSPGLWSIDPLCLDFKLPFVQWYSGTSKKNTETNVQSLGQLISRRDIAKLQHDLEQSIKQLTI